ncbi:hypothetical protein [Terrimonas pollutisoli]|uniref:hypothetical protein n=1 Tax=Terrimonas pollutisoli TaxID=3034147 RepID=UPI0023ED52A9|nr:hypothetical protein [Terrimonas sp. H1YJ31]
MQLLQENRIANAPQRLRKASLPLSSVNVNNRAGKMGIVKPIGGKIIKKKNLEKPADFSTWSLPEQASGYIKCREHDFF